MYRKPLLYLLIISTVIRIILASTLNLGNDEVYYYTYAFHLQSNYFDHPPGIALLIRLFTGNLTFNSELFIRAGSIFCAAIGTLLTYKIGSFLKNQRTGWIAALLYNTSIYCSIIAGTFILPDSPQIIFWLASLLLLLVIIDRLESNRRLELSTWIFFGIANGLCIMCKVHGIFIWGGFGLYILMYRRKTFSIPALYISGFLTLLIIAPIFMWNYSNHFVTYNYHSSRVGVNKFHIDTDSFLQTILGQWFYNSPINVVIAFIGCFVCFRKRLLLSSQLRILMLCAIPMILVVSIMSLFNTVLPHWSGPAFLTFSFPAAVYIDTLKKKPSLKLIPFIIKCCIALMIIIVIGGIGIIKLYPGTIGTHEPSKLGENDFTLDLYGWDDIGQTFKEWYQKQIAEKKLQPNLKLVTNKWFPAAHEDYYIAPLIHSYVVGIGEMNDLHHYVWLNQYRGGLSNGENALCLVPSNYPLDVSKVYGEKFSAIKHIVKFAQKRNATVCRYFDVYLLSNYKK